MTTWYVVAGNIDEHWGFCNVKKQEIAQELADATPETIKDVMYERAYVYVESADMLRGITESPLRVLFVGTYSQRPDIGDIEIIAADR